MRAEIWGPPRPERTARRAIVAQIAVAIEAGFDPRSETAMEPAKPRKWTEEETELLIALAQRKERVPAMRESLDVTSPPLDDGLANWVCSCRKAEVRGRFRVHDEPRSL